MLKAGAQTPAQLRDGLWQVWNFAGVSGLTSTGDRRDTEKVPDGLTAKGGQIVQLNAELPRENPSIARLSGRTDQGYLG